MKVIGKAAVKRAVGSEVKQRLFLDGVCCHAIDKAVNHTVQNAVFQGSNAAESTLPLLDYATTSTQGATNAVLQF